jgi:SAM-dependent methyltransferase
MNLVHRWLCRSDSWRNVVKTHIVPWALEGVDLGSTAVEIGPGPGVTTDLLRDRVQHLTCVEIDRGFAAALARRTAGSNVTVLCEDATAMSLADGAFDSAVSLTMLHHVPSGGLQDRLLKEVARVLRPGGVFVGVDSVYSRTLRLMHLFDTMVLVDPGTFAERLSTAGFRDVRVEVNPYAFRFFARR